MTAAAEHQTHPLFSVQERWGWQYVPAVTPQMSPVAEARPEWVEPPPPKITHLERQLSDTGQRLMQAVLSGTLFVVFGLVAFLLLGGTPIVGAALITIGVVVYGHRFLRVHRARQALRRTKLQRAEDRERRWDDHQRRLWAWEEAVGRHAAEEQLRFASQPLWFPVLPGGSRRRVDVCGGTVDAWASLLTTSGASLLAGGAKLLLVDLTGDDVGLELRALVERSGYRCARTHVRGVGACADVFAGLTSADVVDALALSIREATGDVDDQQAESHALDSEVLELAVSCLDAPYSVARLVAALTFLARPHDADAVARLGEQELQRLAANTDTVVTDTELRRRLSVILARLRPLRDMVLDDEPPALLRFDGALDLAGVTMERGTSASTTALRRLLFNTLALRLRSVSDNGGVLIVAGCDEVSATLFMRLGNTDEASAAAEYVGKEHELVLSQVTHSVGETLTDTAGTSDTWQEGISDTSSTSRGTTTNDGLIARTFIAVARNGYENVVVAADCNPGIVDLDRVASEPYSP